MQFVWLTVSGAGVVLYILLFAIFYKSHQRQTTAARHLGETQDVTIFALAYQAELRDLETGNHIERTSRYVGILARRLRTHPRYKSYLTDTYIDDLIKSAPLHDIGKVGIPDSILQKPGRLDPAEFEQIKMHCSYGAMILRRAEQRLTFRSFFDIALQLVACHHERWDGSGYPNGLKGEDIPLSARIMALADVYDALRSARRYKKGLSHEECMDIICKEEGRHFDPLVVKAFLSMEKEFLAVSRQFSDVEG